MNNVSLLLRPILTSSLQIVFQKVMSDPAQSSQDYSLLELALPLRDEESFSINFICGMALSAVPGSTPADCCHLTSGFKNYYNSTQDISVLGEYFPEFMISLSFSLEQQLSPASMCSGQPRQ